MQPHVAVVAHQLNVAALGYQVGRSLTGTTLLVYSHYEDKRNLRANIED